MLLAATLPSAEVEGAEAGGGAPAAALGSRERPEVVFDRGIPGGGVGGFGAAGEPVLRPVTAPLPWAVAAGCLAVDADDAWDVLPLPRAAEGEKAPAEAEAAEAALGLGAAEPGRLPECAAVTGKAPKELRRDGSMGSLLEEEAADTLRFGVEALTPPPPPDEARDLPPPDPVSEDDHRGPARAGWSAGGVRAAANLEEEVP